MHLRRHEVGADAGESKAYEPVILQVFKFLY